ncbi:MAG: hypothetical protein ACKV2U_17360 [Bryobacteraceae bacterium]
MEVNLSPEIEKKLNEIAAQSGRPAAALAEDAIAGYVDDLADTRAMLDSRYDDIKSGRVKPIDGEEAFAWLRERIDARRSSPA